MASVEKRIRDGKTRYYTRWRDADDRQRSRTFTRKVDADRFAATIAADLARGTYLDPNAGKTTFRKFAASWLEAQTFDTSTREAVELRLRLHALPILGGHQLRQIKPGTIQSWLRTLDDLSPAYRRVIFANVSSILTAAVDDELIGKNPCRAGSVRRPRAEPRKIIPWTTERLNKVESSLPERWRIVATLASGLGLRQGEVFGLSPDDVDFFRGRVEVCRQVKLFSNNKAVFALPKGRKTRTVPLPDSVRDDLAAYLARYPARPVTLPWGDLDGEATTVPLVVTSRENTAANRNYFNAKVWKPTLRAAEVPTSRENGCHALRHWFASTLLDAGESIKAVSEYLGHADAGFTLRTYTHLMPSSEDRTRRAIDTVRRATTSDDASRRVS